MLSWTIEFSRWPGLDRYAVCFLLPGFELDYTLPMFLPVEYFFQGQNCSFELVGLIAVCTRDGLMNMLGCTDYFFIDAWSALACVLA